MSELDYLLQYFSIAGCVGIFVGGIALWFIADMRLRKFKQSLWKQLYNLDSTKSPRELIIRYTNWVNYKWEHRKTSVSYDDLVNETADEIRSFDLQHNWIRSTENEYYGEVNDN